MPEGDARRYIALSHFATRRWPVATEFRGDVRIEEITVHRPKFARTRQLEIACFGENDFAHGLELIHRKHGVAN